jgi:hypothetical protein
MKPIKTAFVIASALAILPINSAFAEEKKTDETPGVQYQIDKTTCRELLQMSGDSRDFSMIFMHGFMSGKKNELLFDAPTLTAATDVAVDYCINNPDNTLLSAFEVARK